MKYVCEIDVNLSREKVVELFDNPENMKYWQPGFISMTPVEGQPGKEGAKSRLKYKMGKREIEKIETIVLRNLPDAFNGTYETKGIYNIQSNKFVPIGKDKTRWISESEFQFSGFMKLIGFLMPGAFRRQSYKYLEHFKDFAEKGKKANA